MKAVILAGGLGSRLSEETTTRPKPMVTIGERPILWHILKIYSCHGINDFVICLGYRGYMIKEYFANYFLHTSDVTFNVAENSMEVLQRTSEPWRVTLIDTGADTMTGGRLARIRRHLDGDFCMTYGDGLSDVDITALVAFHREHGRLATVTGVRPPGRFGALLTDGAEVTGFEEKPLGDRGWINGGFFVLSPRALDFVIDDTTVWEQGPMRELAARGELRTYLHDGYWQCMDTLRDKQTLEGLWQGGRAPWKQW